MGRNKDELIKLAEKITGQECKDVLTKKDALKKIACYYLGEEKEFASIADCLESIVEHGASGGGSGGGDTYTHKVEIKFDNFSLSYYGQESNYDIFSISFSDIANNSIGRGDISASGDTQELLNLYVVMGDPLYNDTFTKESKVAYHMYLKDADTENLVKGIGIKVSTGADSREVGILFNKGTQDKHFTNTVVLEWN